jgi:hypothetical protein
MCQAMQDSLGANSQTVLFESSVLIQRCTFKKNTANALLQSSAGRGSSLTTFYADTKMPVSNMDDASGHVASKVATAPVTEWLQLPELTNDDPFFMSLQQVSGAAFPRAGHFACVPYPLATRVPLVAPSDALCMPLLLQHTRTHCIRSRT